MDRTWDGKGEKSKRGPWQQHHNSETTGLRRTMDKPSVSQSHEETIYSIFPPRGTNYLIHLAAAVLFISALRETDVLTVV
jgi:hypothetical protein